MQMWLRGKQVWQKSVNDTQTHVTAIQVDFLKIYLKTTKLFSAIHQSILQA